MDRKERLGKRKGVYLVVVDSTDEMPVAIEYACQFANAEGGYVAIINVMDRIQVESWLNIEERVRKEQREQAERMIWDAAGRVQDITGSVPIIYIEEGDRSDAILKTIDENEEIVALVLASSAHSSNAGPLITYFSGKGHSRLSIPLLVVPGHLAQDS